MEGLVLIVVVFALVAAGMALVHRFASGARQR
jgi:hypothetical protein